MFLSLLIIHFWVGHNGAQGRLIELKIGKFNCVTVLKDQNSPDD